MERKRRLRIGELAELCGVNTRTVDYYTRIGLIEPGTRSDGNYRLYEPETVQRLCLVKRLQAQRLSLHEIRQRLAEDGASAELAALREIRQELEAINRKLAAVETAIQMEGRPENGPSVSAAASAALGYALAVSTYLEELARHGVTPP